MVQDEKSEIGIEALEARAKANGLADTIAAKDLRKLLGTAAKAADPLAWLDSKAAELRAPDFADDLDAPHPVGRVDHAHRPVCAQCSRVTGQVVYMRAATTAGKITYYYCPNTPTGQGRLKRELREKFVPTTTPCNAPGVQVTRGRTVDPAVEAARIQRTEVGFAARDAD